MGFRPGLDRLIRRQDGAFRFTQSPRLRTSLRWRRPSRRRWIKRSRTASRLKRWPAAKSGWLQTQKSDTLRRWNSGGNSVTHEFDGRTMTWDDDLEKKVAVLTPQQIQEALRRNLDMSAVSIVKAGDFKKAAAAAKQN